jgi:hypothetical protein
MRQIFLAVWIALTIVTVAGCRPALVCPPPEVINCEYKIWPIQRAPAVPGIVVHKLDYPGVIAGFTQEDIDNAGATIYQLFLWGSKNESTLEEVNTLNNNKKQ